MSELLELTERGLYCRAGDFYVDPWQPVEWAIITHAHGDHARPGSRRYLCSTDGAGLARVRLGSDPEIETLSYGETIDHHGVRISLHPAGHVLGSCQVRIEIDGQIGVVSGDYKLDRDVSCLPMETVRCHTFITESTFGLPIYRWPEPDQVINDLRAWWTKNQEQGRTSVLFAYSLGKSQRVLAALADATDPILVHGAVDSMLPAYREAGVRLPPTEWATAENARETRGRALVIAPPSAMQTPWLRKFGPISTAAASGWMQIRGMRRRRAVDRGFILSDHADWEDLQTVIQATGAESIWVTHGYTGIMAHWLREKGLAAKAIQTRFKGESGEETPADAELISSEDVVDAAATLPPSLKKKPQPRERNLTLFPLDD